jgi:hypothetical protein
MALQPFVGCRLLLQFLDAVHSEDSLDGGSARRKASTYTQNNTNTEQTHIDNHVSSGIRTHDPSVRASEGFRPRGLCDRLIIAHQHRRPA